MSAPLLLGLAPAIPMLGAVLIALLGTRPRLREGVTLLTSGALLAVVGALLPQVLDGARPSLHLVEMLPGISLELSAEPLGMVFAGLAAILWPLNSLYSIGYLRGNQEGHQTRFYVWFAVAIASAMGIAFAGNLATLFVCYEVLTFSTYPLVTHHGTEDAVRAGRVYLGVLVSTSVAFLLLAIIWTATLAGTTEFRPGGILAGTVDGSALGVLLALYVFGIGKAALMPVHRWLPAAMVAPTPVSALLHAVAVVKAGVFTVVKVVVYVFGLDLLAGAESARWLVYAAGFTVVAASLVALRILLQRGSLKRLLAYSTVSQLAYVVLAAAVYTPAAIAGATLHIVTHGFAKITLFFAAGSVYTAAHKTEIGELRGIGRRMPWTMGAFAVGALSMIGLPPAGGFVSKWYIMLGAWHAHQWLVLLVLVASTLLNLAYFAPIVYLAFFQREAETPGPGVAADGHGEAPLPMVAALTATASLTILVCLFPQVPFALARAVAGVVW